MNAALVLAIHLAHTPFAIHDGIPRDDRDRFGWAAPDFARVSSGGFIGAANASIGWSLWRDRVHASIGYGFTPEALAGHDVHTADVLLAVRPFRFRAASRFYVVPVELGAGALYVFGHQYRVSWPARYRETWYYPPTALHWIAHLGIESGYLPRSGFFTRHALFYRVTTLDTLATDYLGNHDRISLLDVAASAVGYRAAW